MYFGLNKFVISYGNSDEWPWSDPLKPCRNPVSCIAYENIKSMSISFDLRDHIIPIPTMLRHAFPDSSVERGLTSSWRLRCEKMRSLELKLLDVSFNYCHCLGSGRSLVAKALKHVLDEDVATPEKMVLGGFVSKNEVNEIRKEIEDEFFVTIEDKDRKCPYQIVILF